MAVAHVIPGAGGYAEELKRAASATQMLDSRYFQNDVIDIDSNAELSSIRDWAKRTWSARERVPTTYGAEYKQKDVGSFAKAQPRPVDDTRRNNPHPASFFLTMRLHHVPGYHNADARLGKDPYVMDRSCGEQERAYRGGFRGKYDGGASTAAVRQFASNKEIQEILQGSRPQNESWMADGRVVPATSRVPDVVQGPGDPYRIRTGETEYGGGVGSMHRYLRMAGPEEKAKIKTMLNRVGEDIPNLPNMMIPYRHQGTLGDQKQRDIDGFNKHRQPVYRYLKPRGDFLIQPCWPPTKKPHRIPGFTYEKSHRR